MRNNNSNNADFLLLLAFSKGFKEIEEQSGYSVTQQDNEYCLFEPNALKPFARISIQTLIKDFYNEQQLSGTTQTNATNKQEENTLHARVGRYTDNVFERVRGMVQERDNQAKERSRRSRGEGEERKEISRRSRELSRRSRELSRQDRELSQTNNAICFLLRKQILTQQSPIDDRLELKSIHTKYQELKDEANKARAIRTYLELGGVANDEVLAKFGKTINLGKSQNSLKDNDSNPNAPNVSNTQLTNKNKNNTNNTTNNPANNATNNPTNNNQNPTNPINKPTNTQAPKRRR